MTSLIKKNDYLDSEKYAKYGDKVKHIGLNPDYIHLLQPVKCSSIQLIINSETEKASYNRYFAS